MRACLRLPALIATLLLASVFGLTALAQDQGVPAGAPPAAPATPAPAAAPPANPPQATQPQASPPPPTQPVAQPPKPQPSPPKPHPNPPKPAAAAAPPAVPVAAPPKSFDFANVRHLAQQRAAHEYRPMSASLPASLANLSYDQYRDIRFRPASALWHGQAMFEVQFFHRGAQSRQRINIFEVTPGAVTAVPYDPRFFTFGKLAKAPKAPANLGYAGFRVHYPLQTPNYKDELLVFLGASYFRVLGRNQHYGASARGLAIDTAEQTGEEFPSFTDFWLVRPQPNDRSLIIYALLDSKSVAGAYQFEVRPGAVTQVEVHCELYLRHPVTKLGIAPLTSMYFYGDENRRADDYRPQVHDSDGLMEQTGHGQWLWRPLGNPRELKVNRFMDESPRGFGLIQRERGFSHYQDSEAQYETRPSYWEQPLGNWGKGGVELVEIPSDEEIHDNIVAYWLPAQNPQVGKPVSFAWLLSAFAQSAQWPPGARVVATRTSAPSMGDNKGHFGPGARRMLIDFAGGDLDGMDASQPLKADVSADGAQIDALTVQRVPESGVWRVTFVVTPKAKRPVDLHCFLQLYGEVLTETWVNQWTP